MKRSPTVIVDAAHNPHGAQVLATALQESFTFDSIIGVISVMADKDVLGVLESLEPVFQEVVVTWNGAARAMPVEEIYKLAAQVFGAERVHTSPTLSSAIDLGIELADNIATTGVGVVITGSVVTAARGRALTGHIEA